MVENMIKKVLIISHDKVGKLMAGPGIRYHYMAKTLAKNFDVTVGFFGPENVPEIDAKSGRLIIAVPEETDAGDKGNVE